MNINTQNTQTLDEVSKDSIASRFFRLMGIKEKTQTVNNEEENLRLELLKSVELAKAEWANANMNFEYIDDEDMIDYYTYKIKACQVRYEYLIRKAKEMGIKVEHLANSR